MSKLEMLISKQYNNNLSQKDIEEASNNLLGFFQTLLKIDERLKKEDLIKKSKNKVKKYADNRNSN